MDKQYSYTDELTLKELILAVQDYGKYFLRKWYWFVLGAVVLGGLLFYRAYTVPVKYSAPLTFLLNKESDKGGAGSILGNLGLGGAGTQGDSHAMKLLELSKSRRVLGAVLFDSTTIDGQHRLIADHLIDAYEYQDSWVETSLEGFYFNAGQPAADDRQGNQVFKILHGLMIREEEGILTLVLDLESGLFTAKATTPDPELSIAIIERLYAELADYFTQSTVADKQATLQRLTTRADSVKTELARAERELARSQDRLAQVPLRQSSVRQNQLEREVYILSTMYGEIIKNRETSAFILSSEKPAFTLVDAPLEPLRANREPRISAGVMGVALGGVLVGLVLFFVKLVGDAVREN